MRAGDLLKISVWPDSVLGGQFTVEENGMVVLPELGDVQVGGKDIREIQLMLREMYGKARKSPIVQVTPVFRVGVLGEVQRPGLYTADPTMTWFDVISLAGGFTDRAARDRVTIVRSGREQRINAVTNDAAMAASLSTEVRSGDKVIVPQRSIWTLALTLSVVQVAATLVAIGLQLR